MIDADPTTLAAVLALGDPLAIRTMAFDIPTFDILKNLQRKLESRLKRDTGNAEALRYVLHTHPETQPVMG